MGLSKNFIKMKVDCEVLYNEGQICILPELSLPRRCFESTKAISYKNSIKSAKEKAEKASKYSLFLKRFDSGEAERRMITRLWWIQLMS